MADMTITLPVGLRTVRTSSLGEQEILHREAVLRELTTGDLVNAATEAEKVVLGDDGEYHLVQSPTLAGLHMLRRQIVRIGDIEGPFEVGELLKLATPDFQALQAAADRLDAAAVQTLGETAGRGRDDPAS